MKIAVTADLHIRSEHPERLDNFKNFVSTVNNKNIYHIIIAGDLFDKGFRGYKGFETVVQQFPETYFYIIPGNHDITVEQSQFASENIKVFSKPGIKNINNKNFAFLPYKDNSSVYEQLESSPEVSDFFIKNTCLLITHGDITGYSTDDNGGETGYFPLATNTIFQKYKVEKVFLGHIHKPDILYNGQIYYPGSLFPLHINETGPRYYIEYDTDTGETNRIIYNAPVLYDRLDITIIPGANEKQQIHTQIDSLLHKWNKEYEDADLSGKIKIRCSIKGYTDNDIGQVVKDCLDKIKNENLILEKAIDSSELEIITSSMFLNNIRDEVLNKINTEFQNISVDFKPDKDEIIRQALGYLYIKR